LAAWLREWGVTHVAMESTGIYWVPVWNVLEGKFQLLLANAQQLKKVPGRKSDVSDAEWIAQCQQCGLLKASARAVGGNPGMAATDAATDEVGRSAHGTPQSVARGVAAGELQAGAGGVEHRGGERASDFAGVE
jgi:hypothetical protein